MQLVEQQINILKAPGHPYCIALLNVKTLILIQPSIRTNFAIYISFSIYIT